MKRRTFVTSLAATGLALAGLAAPAASVAQRPSNPIARPLPGRPGGPLGPGRLPATTGGVARSAPQFGVYLVRAVDKRQYIVRLSDDGGRSADVYVDPDIYDLSQLQAGDEVMVDFFVPNNSGDRLEAASMAKLDPVKP